MKTIVPYLILLLMLGAGCRKTEQAPKTPLSAGCQHTKALLEDGNAAFDQEAYPKAELLGRQAAQAALDQGCPPERWAQARILVARSIRLQFGAQRAIDTLQQDLRTPWVAAHPALAGLFQFHIAFALRRKRDFWQARAYYEMARAVHEQFGGVTTYSGQYLYKPLANIYTRLGESEKAVSLLHIALDSAFMQLDTSGIPDIYGDLGLAFMDIGQIDSACQQFQRGLDFIRSAPAPDTAAQAAARSLLMSNWAEAQLLRPLPEPDSAFAQAKAAYDLDPSNTGACLTLGNVSALQGAYGRADSFFQQAEALFAEDPQPLDRDRAKLLLRRANLLLQRPEKVDYSDVLRRCQRALQYVLPAFHPANNFDNPPERLFYPENTILEALDLKSQVLWEAYRAQPSAALLDRADSTTALALAMNDTLGAVYGFESSRLYSLQNTRNLHERYVQILFEQQRRQPAHPAAIERIAAFFEKSRALLLRQKLAGEYGLQAAPIPPDLRQRETDLRRELVYLKNQLAAEEAEETPDEAALGRLRGGIFRVQDARQQLLETLRTQYPEYFDAHYARPVSTLADIRALLQGDSSLFAEYFYNPGSGALYSLGIRRNDARLFQGALPSADLEAFLALVQDENLGRNREGDPAFRQEFTTAARQLYDTLLAPLTGRQPLRELIVSPDGPLGSLPFDLLLPRDPGPDEQSFRQMPYLLRDTRVRFAASATVLRDARALAQRSGGTGYLGAAPGYGAGGVFAPVRFGRDCARSMAGLFRGALLAGNSATRERFCAEAPQFQLLHFYGHGSANGNRPELSYLAFSEGGTAAPEGPADGDERHSLAAEAKLPAAAARRVLFAHEISLLRLRAGLVVLSACETGLGRAAGSEGIFSLARAFQDAGCPSAAMTLWSVDDAATARLTELFLQNIRAGLPKDAALQQAKLTFLDTFDGSAFPYFWSGMVLTGDASALQVQAAECRVLAGDESVSCAMLGLLAALTVVVAVLLVFIFKN